MYYSKNEYRKIIVVGGNAAGPGAAAKAKRTDPNALVTMYEAGDFISTGTCELPYLLSGEISDYNKIVFFTPETFHEEKGVSVKIRHKVTSIDRHNRTIEVLNLKSGKTERSEYDSLILATGSRARQIFGLSDNFNNVFNLKSVGDYLKIREYLEHNKVEDILVVGAGYIGLEVAESLDNAGFEVTVTDRADHPMPGADKEISCLILDQMKNSGVTFLANKKIEKVHSKEYKVTSVKLGSDLVSTDMVIVAAGVEPNSEIAFNAGLSLGNSGGIKVNNKLKTSCSKIFAAGDNSEITDFITGRPVYFPVATMAHAMGHIAGENAAGGNAYFSPVVQNIAVKIFGKAYTQIGLNSDEASNYSINATSVSIVMPNLVKVMPESKSVFGKIIFDKSTRLLLGAQFYGGKETIGYADLISMMIKQKINAEKLYTTDYNYTPPYSPFVNILSVLGKKIRNTR